MSMEVRSLILPYLGKRDYLHGTTLFDALLPLVPAGAEMSFKFSRMIRSNRVEVSADDQPGDASLGWKSAETTGLIHVRPLDPVTPLERRPYPEPLIGNSVEFDEGRAIYAGESPFSFVATLIPL